MTPFTSLALVLISAVSIGAEISTGLKKCREQVVSQCQCGGNGELLDVYVDGCQIVLNDTQPCQPCPGSCEIFQNCKTCSKHDCISCPSEKTGPTCETEESLQVLNENTDTLPQSISEIQIQNTTEIPSHESTIKENEIGEVTDVNLNTMTPEELTEEVSQSINSSFEPHIVHISQDIAIDSMKLVPENASDVEVDSNQEEESPEDLSENISKLPDLPEVCTLDCLNNNSNTNEMPQQNVLSLSQHDANSTSKLNHKVEYGNPPLNEDMNASSENDNQSYTLKGGGIEEALQLAFSDYIYSIPYNLSYGNSSFLWGEDYATFGGNASDQLLKHRSPNPSSGEDGPMADSFYDKNTKENSQYAEAQVSEISENDNLKNPPVVADIKEPTGNDEKPFVPNIKRSIIKPDNKNTNTSTETNYMPLSGHDSNDQNETNNSELVMEVFSQNAQGINGGNQNKTLEIGTNAPSPDAKYNFSKPHNLKYYFYDKNSKDQNLDTSFPDMWKNLCAYYPSTYICRSPDDKELPSPKNDPHSHVEHSIEYFRSPEFTGKQIPVSETKKEHSIHDLSDKINQPHSNASPDDPQSQNNYFFEKLDTIHRPNRQIPRMSGQLPNTFHSFYGNQEFNPLIPSPVLTRSDDVNSALLGKKSIFPSLFDQLLHLIGPHSPLYQDRSFYGRRHFHRSPERLPNSEPSLSMYKSLDSFAQTPWQAGLPNLYGNHNPQYPNYQNPFRSFGFPDTDSRYFLSDQDQVPIVKGQIIIADVGNVSEALPGIFPDLIRSRNFQFEIPLSMSSFAHQPIITKGRGFHHIKSEHEKHGKGVKHFRKLRTRRRNGVHEDTSFSASKCNPRKQDCTKYHGIRKTNGLSNTFSGRKMRISNGSKTWRKGSNIPDRIRMKYIKMGNSASTVSTIVIAPCNSSETDKSFSQSYTDESVAESSTKNETSQSVTLALDIEEQQTTSDQPKPDSGSNRHLFRVKRSTSHFCPIPKETRNGDLDCTIWSYKKSCKLICHSGYSSPHQQFTCMRSKNAWTPPLNACTGGPEFVSSDNAIQMKHFEDGQGNYEEEDDEYGPHDHEEAPQDDVEVLDDSGDEEMTHVEKKNHHTKEHGGKKKAKKAHVNSVKMHDDSHEEFKHADKKTHSEHSDKKSHTEHEEHVSGHKSHTKSAKVKHHKDKTTKKPHVKKEDEEAVILKSPFSEEGDDYQEDTAGKVADESPEKNEADDSPGSEEDEGDDDDYDESEKRKK